MQATFLSDVWYVVCLTCGQCNEEEEKFCSQCETQMVPDKLLAV